tara:strand:+ start:245 stop:640 length:396 start_codon:yes stop_codon:yes gene_type:complete
MSAAPIPEFKCDISGSTEEPLHKIGEEYGEPLHCTKGCIALLLTVLHNIISKSSFPKKDFDLREMVSKDTVTPELINPHEEMKKFSVRMKIIKVQKRIPVLLSMLEQQPRRFINENMGIIGTLATWDCLFE